MLYVICFISFLYVKRENDGQRGEESFLHAIQVTDLCSVGL